MLSCATREAKASFIGYYDFNNFVLTNSGGLIPDGFVTSVSTDEIVLTGTNDGSGVTGQTTFTIPAASDGLFQFSYSFSTFDDPQFEYAGYLIGSNFFLIADTDGESGTVSKPVLAGETIGFLVGSVDNTGFPGNLDVTQFDGPAAAPEPGGLAFMMIAAGIGLIVKLRRNRRLLRFTSCIAVMSLAAALLSAPAWGQQVSYLGNTITGQVTLTSTVNLSQQALSTNGAQRFQAVGTDQMKSIPLLRPPQGGQKLFGANAAPPPVQGLNVIGPSGLTGVTGFNGLSQLDQKSAFGGNQFTVEPPNQSIAAANGWLLEGVNNAVQIYNTSGTPLLPIVLAANQVFGLAPEINYSTGVNGVFPTDMRVFYDQGINRWFVIMRSQDNDSLGDPLTSSHLYMAVSQTGDPTQNYNIYVMNTTNLGHFGCPCIDDYPQVGSDQYGLFIAWNEFNSSSIQFNDAAILALSKNDLGNGVTNPVASQFFLGTSSGYEFAIQPAMTPPGAANFIGNGGQEYFVSTNFNTEGAGLGLWAMTNTSSLWSSPNMTLTRISVPCLSYTNPVAANQPSGNSANMPLGTSIGAATEFLDGGDNRVQSLVYAGGRLYLTFPTRVTDQNNLAVTGGAYVVLSPTFRGTTLSATVVSQGYLVVNGNHLLRPAIAVNAQGTGAIAATLVGFLGNYYPSPVLIPYQALSAPTTAEILAQGFGPEDGFTGYSVYGGDGIARWGDYNTAVVGTDNTIWMVAQWIGNFPRTTLANWDTFVMHK